ncbi:23S rRNA (adenine(2503)-C(2))-methyltransferase RlmN [Anaerobacillus alkalidiazotrophicus]|uniref:Probable dual-specificity RNA methyltransferase RlmN n=1 Tax=Anaerobacillus alkalidiazotrophicus TaxID=472963 RepID=A0A1S2M9I1_9BACI|nr:23S rRNA (adenine(2503)-C(2))-methyltransferase RlmN [Anaerobacillus alkalidiazotrophicus]OIJ21266.1 23S rRNA (adenine(2503)-C(2))-methyltransferase RlmN [Anaerobacillus alkalidiazotrophicus]
MTNKSIYGLTFEQLSAWLLEHGHKKGRAEKVWEWLYRKRVKNFTEMVDVNKDCIQLLQDNFVIETLTEHIKQEASDGTIKFLFKLQDDHLIETVLMRHPYGLSVCVTTQVGCNIGCSFCASGLLTKNRDLIAGEIVEQIMKVQFHLDQLGQGEKVSHIVVMGIGEPFDNFENMVNFLQVVIDQKGLAIGSRKITVSTSGIVGKIYEFTDRKLHVNLAISLHAPNDELRTKIMKINRVYPIDKLMDSIKYFLKTNRRIMLEYILLKGVNDQEEHALELADLLKDIPQGAAVNLIPYNPVDEHDQYQRSEQKDVLGFYETLRKKGIICSIRQEHGTDIDAACGQLRSKQMKEENAKR